MINSLFIPVAGHAIQIKNHYGQTKSVFVN